MYISIQIFVVALICSVASSPVFDRRSLHPSTLNNSSSPSVTNGNPSRYNSSNIRLSSDKSFCSFLPGTPGADIATTERQGKPFCTDSSLGGYTFPEGFIKSAHYVKTENYTQVTGTMNPSVYNMSTKDNGGQYDDRDQNQHTCNGLKYFVNLIEPNGGTFCIRCCVSRADCNIGISQKGCRKIIPGDYK
ncbi:hypothetical protein BY458DRAFT_523774 [Sporodiniella umbellata]|nr:hypothetical protein BY458DRAFT_523774 [Sporodiniella umbellata]